jgi:hypothetical protein
MGPHWCDMGPHLTGSALASGIAMLQPPCTRRQRCSFVVQEPHQGRLHRARRTACGPHAQPSQATATMGTTAARRRWTCWCCRRCRRASTTASLWRKPSSGEGGGVAQKGGMRASRRLARGRRHCCLQRWPHATASHTQRPPACPCLTCVEVDGWRASSPPSSPGRAPRPTRRSSGRATPRASWRC